ncbi:hypothetical protein N7510_008430 [Penicillium lagena]|uniref:uncharacterized protein n=1 Tax=Penicillium lagena TaxID=94218 RepID=UPI0025401788|nr:uncharacterized protein N7510_008430 [Penicillium lagena]KAJ5605649.1 hypothetical protein N7510_008430 [Penicillium lagena]
MLRGNYVGGVVDNNESKGLSCLTQMQLHDFKTQFQRWLAAESQLLMGLSEESIRQGREHTIYVVGFCIWDIRRLVSESYGEATSSVDRHITTLVYQLDLLYEQRSSVHLKAILTQTVDVTFLPALKSVVGDYYQDEVSNLEHWNQKLRGRLPVGARRDYQLYVVGIEAENGLGKGQDPEWENIVDLCVETGVQVMMSKVKKPCEDPHRN